MTPSATPSNASQAATAAAVAASSFDFGTKLVAATITTWGQRSAGRNRAQLIADIRTEFRRSHPDSAALPSIPVVHRSSYRRNRNSAGPCRRRPARAPSPPRSFHGCQGRRCLGSPASPAVPSHRVRSCRCRPRARCRLHPPRSPGPPVHGGCRRCRRKIHRRRCHGTCRFQLVMAGQ